MERVPLRTKLAAGVILGSAAALAACGGGSESGSKNPDVGTNNPNANRTLTPEGGVAGVANPPGGDVSPIVVETPTAEPTVANRVLTQEELSQTATEVFGLISSGLASNNVDVTKLNHAGFKDSGYVQARIDNCVNKVGQTFEAIPGLRTVNPGEADYWKMLRIQCQEVGEATKELFLATGDQNFEEANRKWRDVFIQRSREFRQGDPRLTEDGLNNALSFYFLN